MSLEDAACDSSKIGEDVALTSLYLLGVEYLLREWGIWKQSIH